MDSVLLQYNLGERKFFLMQYRRSCQYDERQMLKEKNLLVHR